jgi:hypothetical protein
MNVARVERSETRGLRQCFENPGLRGVYPRARIRATRWLHPGYQLGADLAWKLL